MADTDEAIREARRQGYEEGRKAERAYVVAWLRQRGRRLLSYRYGDGSNEHDVLECLVEDLEDDGINVRTTKEGGDS